MSLWVIFITGLTVGGLSCAAVQGGLLASVVAGQKGNELDTEDKAKHSIWPIGAFIGAKLIAYTILGFILGLFGQVLQISDSVSITMQLAAALYMLAVALHLLNVHPIFRYTMIQPPRFLTKRIRNQAKSKELFAPALLGAMTVFIPCGTTLAMETLAISSGNPIAGAGIMAAFILGTIPLFFGIGFITTRLGEAFKQNFLQVAALALIYLAVTSFDSALVLAGSPVSLSSLPNPFSILMSSGSQVAGAATIAQISGNVQVVDISVRSNGYMPSIVQVKQGIPVKFNLTTINNYSCSSVFVIPRLGVKKVLPPSGTESVTFTPTQKGQIEWMCSMGMYRGIMEVV